jgi:glycosyltransferase involved in cell wall biosynthesis
MTRRSRPRISIIVPVHDDARHLPAALRSIQAQKDGGCEVIVVDDGCRTPPDGMVRAILPDAVILRQANAGPSAARNRGLRHATGDLVTFLDSDDRWVDDALARLVKGFADAPGTDVVQGHVRRFETCEQDNSNREQVLGPPYLGFNVGALMATREVLLAVGLFDERLRHSEDVDLFIRLHEHGARRLMIPDVVLDYRRHAGSLTATVPPPGGERGVARSWVRLLRDHMARRRAEDGVPMPDRPPWRSRPLTVVVVVKNGMRHLPAALASLRRQTLGPAEIIAIVGASQDGTPAYLAAQPDIRMIAQEGDGLARARNQGLAAARGELIAFLDHDDLWQPRKLELQAEVLGMFARPAACITSFREVHEPDPNDPAPAPASSDRLPRLGWTPSALAAHRDVFAMVGGFDPAMDMGCDADWFRRLRQSTVPCGVTSQALLEKRRHRSSLSSDAARNRAAMFQVLRKHRLEHGTAGPG